MSSPRGSSVAAGGARETSRARAVPRIALTKAEAAESLGCSVDFLEEHVLPDLRVIRRGRKVLVSVRELERWADEASAVTLEAHVAG